MLSPRLAGLDWIGLERLHQILLLPYLRPNPRSKLAHRLAGPTWTKLSKTSFAQGQQNIFNFLQYLIVLSFHLSPTWRHGVHDDKSNDEASRLINWLQHGNSSVLCDSTFNPHTCATDLPDPQGKEQVAPDFPSRLRRYCSRAACEEGEEIPVLQDPLAPYIPLCDCWNGLSSLWSLRPQTSRRPVRARPNQEESSHTRYLFN